MYFYKVKQMTMSIKDRLTDILSRLPQQVRLLAVSKFHPAEAVLEAYEAGQRTFGESRPQELKEKYALLPKDIEWVMIGHLQTNKIKYIAPFISLIESLDSERLAEAINREAQKCGRVIDCLLEIHLTQEESKSGWEYASLVEFIRDGGFKRLPNIRIRGLMGMATLTEDEAVIRADFERLSRYKQQLSPFFDDNFDMLSMGMSDDYHLAIEYGTTEVRIGSTIFGERV